jgi:chromosome segregation ATPase
MNKLSKIAPIIVILACAGSLFFTYRLAGIKTKLISDNQQLTDDNARLTSDLDRTKRDLATTKQTLETTQGELATTTTNLLAREAELAAKTQEAEELKTQVAEKDQELQQTKTELAAAQDTVKKIQDSLGGGSIDELRDRMVAQADENKVLGQQLMAMREEGENLKAQIKELTTVPVNLRGRIAAVQDRWGFMVLNLGREQRVRPNTEFLVYRDTKFVAKVQVTSVSQTTCIAELVPQGQRGKPQVGDLVVH